MSTFYKESNGESTKDLFYKKTIYQSDITRSDTGNLVDFNFGEMYLYGRVNFDYIPVRPIKRALKEIKQTSDSSTPVLATNIAADSFNEMARQFKKKLALGEISATHPYLSEIKAFRAYQSPRKGYDDYFIGFRSSMRSAFKETGINLTDFKDFMQKLEISLPTIIRSYPMTYPAYIKSRYCPVYSSGLVIEVADAKMSNDDNKINQFVRSDNWQFYVNTCNSYGFMIDKEVPWRLVMDIASIPHNDLAKSYGYNSREGFLFSSYSTVHKTYYGKFKSFLLMMYNENKPDSFLVQEQCGTSTISKIVKPRRYSLTSLSDQFPEQYFLKMYFKVRLMEEESSFTPSQKEKLISDCLEIYNAKGSSMALDKFEKIINKTLDYRGSLGYIKEHIEAMKQEQD